jgi:SLOG cluster4 family
VESPFADSDFKKLTDDFSSRVKTVIIEDIMMRLRDYNVWILTGGTSWDVPKLATICAKKYGLPTIWVLPERWEKYSLGKDLDTEMVVNSQYGKSQFGDESPILTKLADGAFVIGGWSGTLVEIAHMMKINEAHLKYDKPLKKIIPVSSVHWVSSMAHLLPWQMEAKQKTFPQREIHDGIEAFEALRSMMQLDDIMKEFP